MRDLSGRSRYVLILAACQSSTIGRGPIRMNPRGCTALQPGLCAYPRQQDRAWAAAGLDRARALCRGRPCRGATQRARRPLASVGRGAPTGGTDYAITMRTTRWERTTSSQLTPATRANVALDEFAPVRRLKVDAAVAALVALGRVLIVGGCLADLYLRHGLRHSRSGCRHTERSRRAGEHYST